MTSHRVAVVGNPNVGKTSLFNGLTASRLQVGNYPGVTVERREGDLATRFSTARPLRIIDLPGTYSLTATSEDEAVAFRCAVGRDDRAPDVLLLVIDASNLARNLYLALQVLELGRPTVVALNMVDVARKVGLEVDADALAACLGVAVVPTVARTGEGMAALVRALETADEPREAPRPIVSPAPTTSLATALRTMEEVASPAIARWLLMTGAAEQLTTAGVTADERRALETIGTEACVRGAEELAALRYTAVERILDRVGYSPGARDEAPPMSWSRSVDRILTHRIFGLLIFVLTMALVFVSIFWWAEPLMGLVEGAVQWLSSTVKDTLGPGLWTDLLTEGVIAGVGNVLVFVPQIALLFLFIGLLEDSGYLARAAFLLDRMMARLGLHGRAFIPLLSGWACAIPAILSTRSIASTRDRLVTVMMIPYMSCSARLPIYALIIGALFVSENAWISPAVDRGLLLLSMYILSTVSALAMGLLFKRTLLRGPTPPLVLELPPYRLPRFRNTLVLVYDRTWAFVRDAGTVILAFTIVLWGVLSFPRAETGAGMGGPTAISQSYGGKVARKLEPALTPIGQDWRMGIGIIGSFAAREVLVSTLGLVYGMEASDDDPVELRAAIRADRDPETGKPRHTPLSGLALMVFFVYACMCMSTLAVVRRETGTWRWPLLMFFSMTGLAYVAAFIVFQGGRLLGFGA